MPGAVFRPTTSCALPASSAFRATYAQACKPSHSSMMGDCKVSDTLLHLDQQGCIPTVRTYSDLLQACIQKRALAEARQVHAHLVRNGLDSNRFLGESLVKTFVKCGSMTHAAEVFNRLPQRTVLSWTAIISGYTKAGQAQEALGLYGQMLQEGVRPNKYVFISLLKACGSSADLEEGRRIHAHAVRDGLDSDPFVSTTLLDMYASCGRMADAQDVFDLLPCRNVVSWNVLIAGYVQQDQCEDALLLYGLMRHEGVNPDERTFVSLLKGCVGLAAMEEECRVDGHPVKLRCLHRGKMLHGHAVQTGCNSSVFVCSTLVHVYATCGNVVDSRQVFDTMTNRDVVSWNSMIAGYAHNKEGDMAVQLYAQMRAADVSPNARTFASVLKACGILAAEEEGTRIDAECIKMHALQKVKTIHTDLARHGSACDLFVSNSLIHAYSISGALVDARTVFDALPERDVVSWNAIFVGYAQQEQEEEQIGHVLQLYGKMQEDGMEPNESTFLLLLHACGSLGSLAPLMHIQSEVCRRGFRESAAVANALIFACGRCGSIGEGQRVFDSLPEPDLVAWNSLIAGYARAGSWKESFRCYDEMRQAGTEPNAMTFASLLSACSHGGMVERGAQCFKSMVRDYGIVPGSEHYASMVDLLGRAGLCRQAGDLVVGMAREPDLAVWCALLGACQKYVDVETGRWAFDRAVSLEPSHSSPYVLMSNIYRQAQMWPEAEDVEEKRRLAGAWKTPGRSWILHDQEVHTFTTRMGRVRLNN